MKILSVVGARPQFVKLAPLSFQLSTNFEHLVLHTGQHYSPELSDIFFKDLGLDPPHFNLNVGSHNHGKQTAKMLEGIEQILIETKPDLVIVFGDTNSTLAGALSSVKINVPVAHIEAGLRSFNRKMPEEINRILTDHMSNILFVPSSTASDNLRAEGIKNNVHIVGDIMFDSITLLNNSVNYSEIFLENLGLISEDYYLATLHRPENTNSPERLKSIIKAFSKLDSPVIFPIHPRTMHYIQKYSLESLILDSNIKVIEPQGPLLFTSLINNSKMVLTDSGGIQKEAYFMNIPCVTLREETEWLETVDDGWNIIAGYESEEILSSIKNFKVPKNNNMLLGKEGASKKIKKILEAYLF